MKKTTYTKEQKQACADLSGVSINTVHKYVSENNLDASDPMIFKAQYFELKNKNAKPTKDSEHLSAERTLAVERAAKAEIDREAAALKLEKQKGESISIEEVEDYSDRLGTLIKTSMEPLPRQMSIMLEGKTAKEIENELAEKVQQILSALANVKK